MSDEIPYTEKLKYMSEWMKIRIHLRCNDPIRWSGNQKYELPSLEYYIKNCIYDKGGCYDFTKRRYKTYCESVEIPKITWCHHENRNLPNSNKLRKFTIYADYMGTPFNYKEIIEIE